MDQLDIDLEEIEEPKWKKALIVIMAIFLIFLFLSYFLTSFGIREIVAGLIESDTVEDGLVEQDVTVEFYDEVYERLLEIYEENQEHETKVCLKGEYDGIYHISEIYEPVIYSQSFNQVVAEACPSDTLIALHSHPHRHCLASEQDLENLEKSKEVNPDALIGIMCETDRFNFYG